MRQHGSQMLPAGDENDILSSLGESPAKIPTNSARPKNHNAHYPPLPRSLTSGFIPDTGIRGLPLHSHGCFWLIGFSQSKKAHRSLFREKAGFLVNVSFCPALAYSAPGTISENIHSVAEDKIVSRFFGIHN
jgi:hypothetical protein